MSKRSWPPPRPFKPGPAPSKTQLFGGQVLHHLDAAAADGEDFAFAENPFHRMAADNAGAAEHLHRLTRDPFMILSQLIFQHGDFGDAAFALADLPNGGVDRRFHIPPEN